MLGHFISSVLVVEQPYRSCSLWDSLWDQGTGFLTKSALMEFSGEGGSQLCKMTRALLSEMSSVSEPLR